MNIQKFAMFGFGGGGVQHRNNNMYHRKTSAIINVILVLHQLFILCSEAYYLDNDPYRHKKVLGPKASYVVEWAVNWKENSITFQVSAETQGWIGFGLSMDGRMMGSDIIIGGVAPSGKPYFDDANVNERNRSIHIDRQQDWKLIGAWEKGKRTYLTVKRPLQTCDPDDYQITKDLVVIIWAYGETDEVSYHMKTRGSSPVYLLDPQISDEIAHAHYRQIGPHSNLYLVQRWALTNTIKLAPKPTSVWCSVQRGPRLLARHDIVGMGAFLPTRLSRRHVQQMRVFKCTSPQQTDAQTFFEPYTKSKGEECYLNERRTLPLGFCRELIYVHGRGGKPFYFPEDSYPIGEAIYQYYLLETTYDNSRTVPNLEIEAGVEFIFSHRQKPNSASLIQVGYSPFGTFMIPPKSVMSVYGSCGPSCTSAMFPAKGVSIFAAMLQTRSLGRRIHLQQFRGSEELKWVLKDDNYDSEFQQMRLLPKYVTLLPGDQLTTQCTYDSRGRNRTSFSGFSTQDEICTAYLYISTRIPFFRCTSEYPEDKLLANYAITNVTWDLTWQDRYVTEPRELEGTWLGDIVDHKAHAVNKEHLQHKYKFSQQAESCPNIGEIIASTESKVFKTFTNDWSLERIDPIEARTQYLTSTVSYPQSVQEYQEAPISCKAPGTYVFHPPEPPVVSHKPNPIHDAPPPPSRPVVPPRPNVENPIRPPPPARPPPQKPRPVADHTFSATPKAPAGPPPTRRPITSSKEQRLREEFFNSFEDSLFSKLEGQNSRDPNTNRRPSIGLFQEPPESLETPPRQLRNPPQQQQPPIQQAPRPPLPPQPAAVRPTSTPLKRPKSQSSRQQQRNQNQGPRLISPPLEDLLYAPPTPTKKPVAVHYFEEDLSKKQKKPYLQYFEENPFKEIIQTPPPSTQGQSYNPATRNPLHEYFEDLQNRRPSQSSKEQSSRRPHKSSKEQSYRPPQSSEEQSYRPPQSSKEQSYRPPQSSKEQFHRPPQSSREQSYRRPIEKPLLQYFEEHPYNQQRPRLPPPPPQPQRLPEEQPHRQPIRKPDLDYFDNLPVTRKPPSQSSKEQFYRKPTEKPTLQQQFREDFSFKSPIQNQQQPPFIQDQPQKSRLPDPTPNLLYFSEDLPRNKQQQPRLRSNSKEQGQSYQRPTEKPALQYFEEVKPFQKPQTSLPQEEQQLFSRPPIQDPLPDHYDDAPPHKIRVRPESDELAYKRPASPPVSVQYFEEPTYKNPHKEPAVHYTEEEILSIRRPQPPHPPKIQQAPLPERPRPNYDDTVKASPPQLPVHYSEEALLPRKPNQPSRNSAEEPRRLKRPLLFFSNEINFQQPQHHPPHPVHNSREVNQQTPQQPSLSSKEVMIRKLKRPSIFSPENPPKVYAVHSAEHIHKTPKFLYQPLEESPQSRHPIQEHDVAASPPKPATTTITTTTPSPPQVQKQKPTTPDLQSFLDTSIFSKPSDITIPVVKNKPNFDLVGNNAATDSQSFLNFFEQLATIFSPSANSRSNEVTSNELVKTLASLKNGISVQNVQQLSKRSGMVSENPKPKTNNIKLLLLQQTKFD